LNQLPNNSMQRTALRVAAWISESNVYSLNGQHIGWFENGVI
jgi:hypothetical protein